MEENEGRGSSELVVKPFQNLSSGVEPEIGFKICVCVCCQCERPLHSSSGAAPLRIRHAAKGMVLQRLLSIFPGSLSCVSSL